MDIIRRNYKSDLDFILHVFDCNEQEIGFPDFNFEVKLWSACRSNSVTAGCHDGECTNLYNDGGRIHVVLKAPKLGCGLLMAEFRADLPNEVYPDGDQTVFFVQPIGIELVRASCGCPNNIEIETILPAIKGEAFTYEDFTEEQIAVLQRPAQEAAQEIYKLEDSINKSEQKRINSEEQREANEGIRVSSEKVRVDNETLRQDAEKGRVTEEKNREKAENARVKAEENREEAENNRAIEFSGFEEKIAAKQDRITASEDFLLTPESELSLTERAKQRLFDDLWLKAVGPYGSIDHTHVDENGKEAHYYLNEIWMPYSEALMIMKYCGAKTYNTGPSIQALLSLENNDMPYTARTALPIKVGAIDIYDMSAIAHSNNRIQIIRFCTINANRLAKSLRYSFNNCTNLVKILGEIHMINISGNQSSNTYHCAFTYCIKLQEVRLRNVAADISLQWSPLLSSDSLSCLVKNRIGTNQFTVTVHPDVYAKLTGDLLNEAATALTEEERAEWAGILTDAAARNIVFATL